MLRRPHQWIVLGALMLLANAFYIDGKALVAQYLVARSWESAVDARSPVKPWSWADTAVVAKLTSAETNTQLFIFQDASGESLAFGPGQVAEATPVHRKGHIVIAGHRDTHFDFLQRVDVGQVLSVEDFTGRVRRYEIEQMRVIDSRDGGLSVGHAPRLTLITCYPFNAPHAGGPLRYLVEAKLLESTTT